MVLLIFWYEFVHFHEFMNEKKPIPTCTNAAEGPPQMTCNNFAILQRKIIGSQRNFEGMCVRYKY